MTLADFKRKAVVGAEIRGGYFWKLGLNNKSISDCEWRTIDKVQSNGIKIAGSFLDFPKANACDFDGQRLKIYETGWRKLTEEEKQALAEWHEIKQTPQYKEQLERDLMTDTSGTYWQEKNFFEQKGMAYLFERTATKELDKNRYNNGEEYCVRDNSAPHGKQIAEYEIK